MRRKKLIIRWSLVTGAAMALFWAARYFVVGSVPVVTSIQMGGAGRIILPFGVSRWWDIINGPIWSSVFVLLLTNPKPKRRKEPEPELIIGLLSGLGVCLLVEPDIALGIIVFISILTGLLAERLEEGLVFILAISSSFSLASGLIVGLLTGIASTLLFSTIFGLIYLSKKLPKEGLLNRLWDWLLVR